MFSQFYQNLILKNPKSVFLILLIFLLSFGYHSKDFRLDASSDTLLIDGETALPRYSKIQGGNGITVDSYTEQNKEEAKIIDQLVVIASSYNIKLVIVASKPFTRKIDIFKNYSIALGLCNYGSGMATPVYILNTTMFLCGYDSIDKTTYKYWAWHYDSYCHKERKEDAIRVESSDLSDLGFSVSINSLEKRLDDFFMNNNFDSLQ